MYASPSSTSPARARSATRADCERTCAMRSPRRFTAAMRSGGVAMDMDTSLLGLEATAMVGPPLPGVPCPLVASSGVMAPGGVSWASCAARRFHAMRRRAASL